jgi:hypothetical protein
MDYEQILREVARESDLADAAAFTDEARRFLRELDPESSEAMWFEALAESYPSRLEAALVYVRDVKRRR